MSSLKTLLQNHEDLKDFPGSFEPLFPDLYPSTVGDIEWYMIAPEAERFLSAVQQYVHSKGAYDPEEKSPGWIFIELFRPSVTRAIERAVAYRERMATHQERVFGSSRRAAPSASASTAAVATPGKTGDAMPSAKRDKVFISYSHKDKKFVDELLTHLKPLERANRVRCWSDQQIQPGSQWFSDIQAALASTKVALLLVTKDFLNSDFIDEHELGPLLKDAAMGGVAILWVHVRDCLWHKTPLKDCLAAIPPQKPLARMKAERDKAWVAICERVEAAVNVP